MKDIRDIATLWSDDISFCPEECNWKSCPRNKKNIRDKTIPHSYFVETPSDCPKNNKVDNELNDEQGHITQVLEIVWCSQCIHAREDCEIAFCFGRRDDWFCADGMRRTSDD